jgi:uncharacterized ferritin-like protein (DUF455 family)
MELHDLARQILFATTLEGKLRCPEIVTDEQPGSPIVAPSAPGRPQELCFKSQVSDPADFPGVHHLEQERERGRLLHFFANHELLATELMALVLLRFPEAPAAFRRGVLQTLREEQEHTRLYLARMKECGIQFGELPVSGYFWRCVAPMEHPIDYVAGLCLTFEQANLDFANHYARSFTAVGDADTARLLKRIYRDEIRHVAYGLKWFRRWKNPDESDWAAFCRQLRFPLSPQRAKGFALNVAGRRAAGLDPKFIAELNVYSQSRGRTPSVFVFNPFSEGYIARGKGFAPVKHQAQLALDLANLPQFLCRQDDIVLVPRRPSVEFLSGIKQAGFALPEFVEIVGGQRLWSTPQPQHEVQRERAAASAAHTAALQGFASRKLGRLRPWAWGPESVALLAPLFGSVTGEKRTANQRFNDRISQLYSKAWSAALLRKIIHRNSQGHETHSSQSAIRNPQSAMEPWLCSKDEIGTAVNSLDEALAAIAAIRQRGHQKIVVKEAIGVAGHNAIRLWESTLLEAQRRWITRALDASRTLVIEPWLDRVVDFSVQLEMGPAGLKLCGYTGLINDDKGQFRGNWAESHHHRRLPARVLACFAHLPAASRLLQGMYADIFALLEEELRQLDYLGPVGIDAFVYRAPEGGCRLKPIVEINPRYTMGRLTVELMRQTCPGSCGLFRLLNYAQVRSEGFNDFSTYARSLAEKFPLRLEGTPITKIHEGALCLNDPAQAQVCLATFQIGRTVGSLVK